MQYKKALVYKLIIHYPLCIMLFCMAGYPLSDGEFQKGAGFLCRNAEGCGDLAAGGGAVEKGQEIVVRLDERFGEDLVSSGVNDRVRADRGEAFNETTQVYFPGLEQIEDFVVELCQSCAGSKGKAFFKQVGLG